MIENFKVNPDGSFSYDISDENKEKIFNEAIKSNISFTMSELTEQASCNTDFKDIIISAVILKSIKEYVKKEDKDNQKKKARNKRKANKRRN